MTAFLKLSARAFITGLALLILVAAFFNVHPFDAVFQIVRGM